MFFFKKLFLLLLLVVLAGGGYWFFKTRSVRLGGGYQAVFLSNGQVYFGKLKKPTSEYPVLKDVYYLVVQRPLQQAAAASEEGEVITSGEALEPGKPQFTLVKLGGELHGPRNEMKLNRRHILFIEDLKDDSKVVQKIKEYEAGASGEETEEAEAEEE